MPATIDPVVNYWSKVIISETGCWGWTAGLNRGYGCFGYKGKAVAAHRFSWEHHFGPIPARMSVLHKCDNPICSRPDHLFLGTRAENNKDRAAKGRTVTQMVPGERHPAAKLNWDAVREIRQGRKAPYKHLMAKYGVSKSLICAVRNHQIWKEA